MESPFPDFKASSSFEDFVNMEFANFQKSSWYEQSSKVPPALPNLMEDAFNRVYFSIMQPKNWYKYQPNVDPELRKAIFLSKSEFTANTIPAESALLAWINLKVEQVLSEKYKKLAHDNAQLYQPKIRGWYKRYNPVLQMTSVNL
jgi:hypothetical protein